MTQIDSMKHTPGPWTSKQSLKPVDGEYDFAISAEIDGRNRCIAEVFGRVSETHRPNAEANARLIAAAPELLAALVQLLDKHEANLCHHEQTYRGGVLWTICDDCGEQWADDRGGFVPYTGSPEIVAAREAIAKATGAK